MKKVVLVMALVVAGSAFAQPNPDTLWTRLYNQLNYEVARCVRETMDGGYAIAGWYYSESTDADFYLRKTDSQGNIQWLRTFGGATSSDKAYSLDLTSDGGYIMAGYTQLTQGENISHLYVVKTNGLGNPIWSRTYGGSLCDDANSVVSTADGGFIVAGSHYSTYGTCDNPDYYVVKINNWGDTLWTRTYGGSGEDVASSIQQTTDEGYIIAGGTNSFGAGSGDFYLVKTNSQGDTLWTRTYGGSGNEFAFSVQLTPDGGCIMAGGTGSYGVGGDFYLVKTNAQGDTLWTHTYGGNYQEWANSIEQTIDGGYIVAGSTTSFGAGSADFYLVKINSLGDTLWTRTYGGIHPDKAWSVQQTADGGYIIAGELEFPYYHGSSCLVKTGPDNQRWILSPNGGEEWHILQFDTILWASPGVQNNLRIELNRNYPSETWEVLSDSTENDSQEVFFIMGPPSDHCRIKISAIETPLFDISDLDFLISSSQGYLAIIRSDNPEIAVIFWNVGVLECAQSISQSFRLKNFGNESIIIYPPALATGQHFSLESICDTLNLAPGQVSACSLVITYDPLEDGVHYDTLMIMSDAINSQGGYVRIPLQGQQISTPQTPIVMITIEGNDARLTWEPITESILGCPVTVTYYLVFYSEEFVGPYWFHGYTADTTYVHQGAVRFTDGMFYEVIAITEPLRSLDEIASCSAKVPMTKEAVLDALEDPGFPLSRE